MSQQADDLRSAGILSLRTRTGVRDAHRSKALVIHAPAMPFSFHRSQRPRHEASHSRVSGAHPRKQEVNRQPCPPESRRPASLRTAPGVGSRGRHPCRSAECVAWVQPACESGACEIVKAQPSGHSPNSSECRRENMTPREFAKMWFDEKAALVSTFLDDSSQSSVSVAVSQLGLSPKQIWGLRTVLDLAIADTMYTLLLGLDGCASIGGRQETYRLFAPAENRSTGMELLSKPRGRCFIKPTRRAVDHLPWSLLCSVQWKR